MIMINACIGTAMVERIVESESESEKKKCNSAFSPCTRRVPPSTEGHAASGLYHTVCEQHLVLANLSDRGKRQFTIFKIEGRK